MDCFTRNPQMLRLVCLMLVGVLFCLKVDQVAGDHSMCLPDGPDIHQKDGMPCVWMDGYMTTNDIMGVCYGSYCKSYPNKANNFIFRGLFQRVRDLNERVHYWDRY